MKAWYEILINKAETLHTEDIDDIDQIFALRFQGVSNDLDFQRVVSSLEYRSPVLIRQKVDLNSETIPGTHSYEIHLLNGDVLNIPVWN